MKKSTFKIFRQVFKITHFRSFVLIYFAILLICAVIMRCVEPGMTDFRDSLWYCFVAITTIGFGDYTAVTILGRIVTMFMYLYSLVVIALFTSIITNVIAEITKTRYKESKALLLDDLQHLEDLPKERLAEISQQFRSRH